MNPVIGGALIGLAGTGLQGAFGMHSQSKQHGYSKDLLKYQWSEQIPTVVNSLKKAGLNPALMYSNGGPSVGGSTGSTTAPQIQNPLLGVGELILDQQFKKEQIEAMKIENIYREQRLMNENLLGSLKLKTEEANQRLLEVQTKHEEQQTKIGAQVENLQMYLSEYQREANPYLISKAHAEWNLIMEEAQKFKDDSEQVRIATASLASRLLAQYYETVARTGYYRKLGSAVETNAATQKSAQELRKELQPRMVAVQEAAQSLREDMSSSEKWKNYMSAVSSCFDVIASAASVYGNVGKGSQSGAVKLNTPYGTDLDL